MKTWTKNKKELLNSFLKDYVPRVYAKELAHGYKMDEPLDYNMNWPEV